MPFPPIFALVLTQDYKHLTHGLRGLHPARAREIVEAGLASSKHPSGSSYSSRRVRSYIQGVDGTIVPFDRASYM